MKIGKGSNNFIRLFSGIIFLVSLLAIGVLPSVGIVIPRKANFILGLIMSIGFGAYLISTSISARESKTIYMNGEKFQDPHGLTVYVMAFKILGLILILFPIIFVVVRMFMGFGF